MSWPLCCSLLRVSVISYCLPGQRCQVSQLLSSWTKASSIPGGVLDYCSTLAIRHTRFRRSWASKTSCDVERFAILLSVFIIVLGSAMPVLAELYLPPMSTQVPVEVRVLQRHDSLLAFGLMLVLFIVVNLFSLLASASVGDSEDDFQPPYVFLSSWLTS